MSIEYIKLKAYNPDLLVDVEKGFITADVASASGTLTVESIAGIGVGDYLLLGEFGQENAEIVRVHIGTAPSGTTITLNANTTRKHERGTAFYRIDRDQVEFSRATTLAGSKAVLSTASINPESVWTIYEDITNTTGFGFYRFKNSGDTTFTGYSESIPYTGYGEETLKKIFDSVRYDMGMVDEHGEPTWEGKIGRKAMIQAVIDCQEDLAKARSRWSFLTNFDATVSELSTGEDAYDLPSDIAYEDRRIMIQAVRVGGNKKLRYIDKNKFNEEREEIVKTTLGSAITSTTQTTITLTDSSDFDDSGNIQVIVDDQDAIDNIAYTANDRTTNTLSGVTGILETVTAGANVWQGATFGEPSRYTIYEDKIYLDYPPSADWEDYNLIMDYYAKPTVVDDLADEVQFPASVIKPYVIYKMMLLRGDGDLAKAQVWFAVYNDKKSELIQNENRGQVFKFTPNRTPKKTVNLASYVDYDDTATSSTD